MINKFPFPFVDCHSHLTNSILTYNKIETLLHKMDLYGVTKTIGFAFPFITRNKLPWQYTSIGDNIIQEFYKQYEKYLIPFLCGFDPTKKESIDYVEKQLATGKFKGIGELIVGKTEWLPYLNQSEKVNHSVLIDIYNIASQYQIPVIIHCDYLLINDFVDAIKLCPKTTFILAHCSSFRKDDELYKTFPNLLEEYDNFYGELSWDFWYYELFNLDNEVKINNYWIDIIEKYSDRFIIGFDNCGEYINYKRWVQFTHVLFSYLSSETIKKLSYENISKILKTSII